MKRAALSRVPIRRLVTGASLVFAWCALWGDAGIANLASGVVVAGLVIASGIGTAGVGGLRLRPLARFAVLVAADLVVSTINLAKEILTPIDHTDEAIIAVRVRPQSRRHLLILVVAITVTPGTAVVDADPENGTLYLHLLHYQRRQQLEEHVRELADLACAALPVSPTPSAETASNREESG